MIKHLPLSAVMIFAVVVLQFSAIAEEPESNESRQAHRKEVRTLLEAGQKSAHLPEGVIVRVRAHLYHVKKEKLEAAKARGEILEESLKEIWEFTSTKVHRLVYEADKNGKHTFRRVESRPFDSRRLCQELLEGKFLEIGTGKGTGEPTQYEGSDYYLGGRSVEIIKESVADPLLYVGEHCTGPGYPESDAKAFGELYENLARQARTVFKDKAANTK